jgi:hypothetical protein
MFKDVRTTDLSAPIVADFTAAAGTPVVVVKDTGQAFVYANNTIAPIGPVNVKGFGAKGDGSTDDTAAFVSALAASKHLKVPNGTYMVDTVALVGNGWLIEGESPKSTIIKARAGATKLLDIHGSGSYATNNSVKNLTLDLTNMTDAATSYGIYMAYSYNNRLEQVFVQGNGSNKKSLYCECSGAGQGVYTTLFDSCDFGSTTGKIRLLGNSTSDAITTLTFIGCAFGGVDADHCVQITFLQPIVQGDLDKFDLADIDGLTIIGGDIEGGGTYLKIGTTVNHLATFNNERGGFSGTHMTGTPASAILMDFVGSNPMQVIGMNGGFTFNATRTYMTAARFAVAQGASVAAANDLALGADGNYFQITGATQINRLDRANWQGGSMVTLKFNSAPTVKHNQAGSGSLRPILLAGGVDFVASANDTLTLRADATDNCWYEVARSVI